jgi:TPR repeat protein
VPKNYKFSYAWARLAAAEGHKGASQHRDDIAKLLSTITRRNPYQTAISYTA